VLSPKPCRRISYSHAGPSAKPFVPLASDMPATGAQRTPLHNISPMVCIRGESVSICTVSNNASACHTGVNLSGIPLCWIQAGYPRRLAAGVSWLSGGADLAACAKPEYRADAAHDRAQPQDRQTLLRRTLDATAIRPGASTTRYPRSRKHDSVARLGRRLSINAWRTSKIQRPTAPHMAPRQITRRKLVR
jgi:hypothetical protein